MEEFSTKRFQHRGRRYLARFFRRPFREGLEVRVLLASGHELSAAELGLGEKALVEKLKVLIDQEIGPAKGSRLLKGAQEGRKQK